MVNLVVFMKYLFNIIILWGDFFFLFSFLLMIFFRKKFLESKKSKVVNYFGFY